MAKARPNQKFHLNELNTALDALDKLDKKPKEELTLRESIYFMRGKLNAALRKGYSYDDLSEILAEQKILVSAATLKLYLTEGSKSKGKGKGRNNRQSASSRGKKVKAADNSSSELSSVSSTNVNDSKEELADSNSSAEINRMKEKESEVTPQTASVDKFKNRKNSKTKDATAKPKRILSGLDDDLSSEFNQY